MPEPSNSGRKHRTFKEVLLRRSIRNSTSATSSDASSSAASSLVLPDRSASTENLHPTKASPQEVSLRANPPSLEENPSPSSSSSKAHPLSSDDVAPFVRRDLWSDAAKSLNPQIIKKWQLQDENTSHTQNISNVLKSAKERACLQQEKVWKRRWLTLINSISTFKSLVDAGMQFDPTGYGTLAWSIVSFGLEVAINNSEISNDLFENCDFIRSVLDEYAMYEAHYLTIASKGRIGLERCIVNAYKAVITYTAEMNYYLNHKGDRLIKAMRGSSNSSLADFKTKIEEIKTAARQIINDIRNELLESDLKAIRTRIEDLLARDLSKIGQFVDDQQKEILLAWVSKTTMDSLHVTQRDKAQTGDREHPGEWILNNPDYVKWENSNKTSSLWLTGGVGTGKTIVASTVIEARSKNREGPMAYFYCSGTSENGGPDETAEAILKCLLRQFVAGSNTGFSLAHSKWRELQKLRSLTRIEVLELFGGIITCEETVEATIIIDGMDELNSGSLKTLLLAFQSLLTADQGILKIFASSRWDQRIEDCFSAGLQIDNITHHTQKDMAIFIDSSIKAEARGRRSIADDLLKEIKKILQARASGMFRYVELALKYIFDGPTTSRIRERLDDLPLPASGDAVLRPMYEKLYQEIEKEDPVYQLLAQRVIQWLLSQLEPQPSETLLIGVCSFGDNAVASKLRQLKPGKDEVKAACHHLVVFNETNKLFEFGHFSVIEFLHWKKTSIFDDASAHSMLAEACLTSLTTPEKEFHLLKSYAKFSWLWHVQHASLDATLSVTLDVLFNLFWNKKNYFQDWFETVDLPGAYYAPSQLRGKWKILLRILRNQKSSSTIMRWILACTFDLSGAAENLVECQEIDFEDISSMFVCGIKLAVAYGSVKVLKTMLFGRFINAAELHHSGTSLLHHAANYQNFESIKACLEWFPDQINQISSGALSEEWKSTPLLAGLCHRRPSSVPEILLILNAPGFDIDVGVMDKKVRSFLYFAAEQWARKCEFKEKEPLEFLTLLQKGGATNLFRRDIDGLTVMVAAEKARIDAYLLKEIQIHPLQAAARSGDLEALQKLILEHSKSEHLIRSAFFLVVEKGHTACVTFMLESLQLAVDGQDQDGFSALMVAAIHGQEHIIQQLRLKGADIMLETRIGRTALFFAIQNLKLNVIRALLVPVLASPFDINYQDSVTGGTAFHYLLTYTPAKRILIGTWRNTMPLTRQNLILRILLDYQVSENGECIKANINLRDNNGETAGELAAKHGISELGISLGCDNFPNDSEGFKGPDMEKLLGIRRAWTLPEIERANTYIRSWHAFESFEFLCYTLANYA